LKENKKAQKPRTQNGSRFAKEFEDEDFLKAVHECMEEATCTAAEVAEKVGCNSIFAKNRLLQLAEEGKLCKKLKGRTWGFRPGKSQ
jgi:ribosomal protein S25